jgi:hypothetical protein
MTDQQLEQVLNQAVEELPARCKYTLGRLLDGASYEVIAGELTTYLRPVDAAAAERLHHRAIKDVLKKTRAAKVNFSSPVAPRPPAKTSVLNLLGLAAG